MNEGHVYPRDGYPDLKIYARALADLFFPRFCIVCGRTLRINEAHLCIFCMADMPKVRFSGRIYNQMSERFNQLIQRDLQAGTRDGPLYEPYSFATSLFFYHSGDGYGNIAKDLKYRGNLSAGRYFARMLGRDMASSALYADIDLVVPVPLHPIRRWRRGYNQAELIAREVARETDAVLATDLIKRKRRTRTQTRVSPAMKDANVRGAFSTNAGLLAGYIGALSGRKRKGGESPFHILLVDDTFTTGATLNACRLSLRESLAKLSIRPLQCRISIATLAFVGDM